MGMKRIAQTPLVTLALGLFGSSAALADSQATRNMLDAQRHSDRESSRSTMIGVYTGGQTVGSGSARRGGEMRERELRLKRQDNHHGAQFFYFAPER